MGRLHDLHRLARAVAPAGTAPAAGVHAAVGRPTRGKVQLFAGCTGVAHQAGALRAATRLLQVSGYDVVVARAPTCCGALSAHAGDPHRAGRLANRTRAAIAPDVDALISIASGCGVHLDAYQPPLPVRHVDVCRFLVEQRALAAADFAALPAIVAIHTPCSIENVYHGGDWVPALLELIPDCQLVRVGEPGQCCGAAGDHMLRRPTVAATLRKPLLDEIGATGAAVLVTGNVGCAMHLAAGFACDDSRPEVLHPVELLARACSHAVRQLQ